MDREIKFRGLVGNVWVYGYLFKQLDGEYRIFEPGRGSMIITQGSEGQFIGIKDKNGVDIYEGDKVDSSYFKNAIVEMWECGWYLTVDEHQHHTFRTASHTFEVVGNIHQSELLK